MIETLATYIEDVGGEHCYSVICPNCTRMVVFKYGELDQSRLECPFCNKAGEPTYKFNVIFK